MSKHDNQYRINKAWRARNPIKVVAMMRAVHYKRKYNQTIADYDLMFAQQGGCCAMCSRDNNYARKYFAIDHDHFTGKARGLLCTACNWQVGSAERLCLVDEVLLEKVEQYLTGRVELL